MFKLLFISVLNRCFIKSARPFSYVNFVDFFNNVDSYAKEFVRNKGNPDGSQGKFEFQ